jgi:hypothetical protein
MEFPMTSIFKVSPDLVSITLPEVEKLHDLVEIGISSSN